MNTHPTEPASSSRRLIGAAEVARLLDCSPRTVYRLADAGHIPWGVKLGHLRRWDILQLEEFIAAGSQSSRTGRR